MNTQTRYRGALAGLAAGDALGTTLEFRAPGSFAPLTDMVGGGPFGLQPGQWTDDTSMALCLAESLVECRGMDLRDQMQRYLRWYREGYWSSTGTCFDIGNTVRSALNRFSRSEDPYAGSTDPHSAGNGSIMRLVPVPMAFAATAENAVRQAAESSRTTHGTASAVDACRYFAGLLVGALRGEDKTTLLTKGYCPVPGLWQREPLMPDIAEIAAGSFKRRQPPEIKGSGYVVRSLEAALWAFYHSDDFRSGALMAVNLGDDADTTGAIYGQLAGACYGLENIPGSWLKVLTHGQEIIDLADQLLALAEAQ